MANIEFSKTAEDERFLLISFVDGRPMTALQVATLLRALGGDYRAMTGRDLVLAHLEIGSTWLWLVDAAVEAGGWLKGAASVAKSMQDLGSFAKNLAGNLKPKPKLLVELPDSPDKVEKSVVAAAKVSEETNSIIRIRHTVVTDKGRETLDVTVTPVEAKEARKQVRERPKAIKTLTDTAQALSVAQRYQIAQKFRELPPATRELETLIEALVRAHASMGSIEVLSQVADVLEIEGRWDIANIIRRYLPRGRNEIHTDD